MLGFRERPYHLLFLASVLLLMASIFTFGRAVDIHLHDTYFVIALRHICWSVVILLLTVWTGYLLTKRVLFSNGLIWAHVFLTISPALLLVVSSFYYSFDSNGSAGMPGRYYDNWSAIIWLNDMTRIFMVSMLLLILGLFTYFVNLVTGLVRYIK